MLNLFGFVSQSQSATFYFSYIFPGLDFMDAEDFLLVEYPGCLILYGGLLTYSVAREPNLEKWTERADVCEMLHEPVGRYSGANLEIILSISASDGYVCIFLAISRSV